MDRTNHGTASIRNLPMSHWRWPASRPPQMVHDTHNTQSLAHISSHPVACHQRTQEGNTRELLEGASERVQKAALLSRIGRNLIDSVSSVLEKANKRETLSTQSGFTGWREGLKVCTTLSQAVGDKYANHGEDLKPECVWIWAMYSLHTLAKALFFFHCINSHLSMIKHSNL